MCQTTDENFSSYSKLLKQLHQMFDDGLGDSEESNVIREDMLDHWKLMTQEEQDRARALSVELKRKARERT